jgi:arylsulfatase A-like enzyme
MRLAAALLASAIAGPGLAQQPNIVVVMYDDLRGADIRAFMPRLADRMPEGREYRRAYACFTVCAPARVCFLTGQNPPTHGVLSDEQKLASHEQLLPRQLHLAGYHTAIVGKDPQGVPFGMGRIGFDDWAVIRLHGRRDDDDRYFDPTFETPAGLVFESGYTPARIGQRCLDVMDTAPRPYFLWCADIAPHSPNVPKPEHGGSCADIPFPIAGRPSFNEADISDKPGWFDPLLMDAGKAAKQAEKWRTTCETMRESDKYAEKMINRAGPGTIVMVTGDHGMAHGDRRLTGKLYLYEEMARIPLIVFGGDFAPGVDSRLVQTTDLTTTIFALAGAEPGRPLDFAARDIRGNPRQAVKVWGRWGEQESAPGPSGLSEGTFDVNGVRHFQHLDGGGSETYDLETDPWQTQSN